MNEPGRVSLVNAHRTPSGGYTGTCTCGWTVDGLPARGAVVQAFVEHMHAEHPENVRSLMAALAPYAEYCDGAPPVAEFVELCRLMWGESAPRKRARRRRP